MLAITLTFSALFAIMSFFVGGVIGWMAKQYLYEGPAIAYTHPEMFDQNGNLLPDEILAVRFENAYDSEDED